MKNSPGDLSQSKMTRMTRDNWEDWNNWDDPTSFPGFPPTSPYGGTGRRETWERGWDDLDDRFDWNDWNDRDEWDGWDDRHERDDWDMGWPGLSLSLLRSATFEQLLPFWAILIEQNFKLKNSSISQKMSSYANFSEWLSTEHISINYINNSSMEDTVES